MKNKSNLFFAGVMVIVLSSCAPAYIPNAVNTPLFSNRNEFQMTMSGGLSGFDVHLAYSPTDFLGLMLNGSYEDRADSNGYHKHLFAETGVGYYRPFGIGRFEIFAGYGFGSVDAYFRNDLFTNKANAFYHRIFIQPEIGLSTIVFDASISPRLVFVNMHLNGSTYEPFNTGKLDPYFEPVLTFKVGYNWVKFVAQFGVSLNMKDQEKMIYEYKPFIFNLGLQMRIGSRYNALPGTVK